MMVKPGPLAHIGERFSSFQSNKDRKKEQRMGYKTEYHGKASRWMGSGVVPPKKGGQGRRLK